MIKNMLLTAQLALSPIVGTNGLQPKRLANPVYGETIDYSVTYNGETYTRLAYWGIQTKWSASYNATEDGYLMLRKDGVTSSLDITLVSNAGTGIYTEEVAIYCETEQTYIDAISTLANQNLCVSFFAENLDGATYYYEIFYNSANGVYTTFLYEEGENAYTYLTAFENQSDLDQTLSSFASHPDEGRPQVVENRHIPQNQPTIANPSVYDNIYNFYYENLFANEALDDLNAEVGSNSLTMRQWLAHTATIVSISLLACALIILVIKIFKLIAGSLSDIWG